jgi:MFS family permease
VSRSVPIRYAARALRGSLFVGAPVSDQVRHDFRLDLIGSMLFGIFNGSVISYLYVVGTTIGVSPVGISFLVAMPAVGSILALPVSLAIRGPGGRRFMFIAWTAGRAAMLLTVLSSAPLLYLVLASIYQVSSNIASPFYAAMMERIYPREFRGRLMSSVRIGSGAITTLTSLVVAALLGSFKVRFGLIFAVGGILSLLSVVTFTRVKVGESKPRPRRSLRQAFAILKRNPPFAEYQLAVFIMGFGNIIAGTLYPLVVVHKLHAGYGAFGILTVCSALGYLLSFFTWGRVVDRKGPLFTMLLTGIGATAGPAVMLIAPGVYWLIPVALLAGINNAGFELGMYSSVIHFARESPPEVPNYMAMHMYFSGLRGITAPFLATGILAIGNYNLALGAALLGTFAGTSLLWNRVRAQKREEQMPASAAGGIAGPSPA